MHTHTHTQTRTRTRAHTSNLGQGARGADPKQHGEEAQVG